ncbi:MAG: hypothetical protein P9M03_08740 [Candidatus Theseobacter exili]|nr:hypothetical protein [Candidatus Theseobacter exili]
MRVQYKNGWYDYLHDRVFNHEIALKNIRRFYRPSEKRWVTIGVDAIRGMSGVAYDGPERRGIHPANAIMGTSIK